MLYSFCLSQSCFNLINNDEDDEKISDIGQTKAYVGLDVPMSKTSTIHPWHLGC